jgi:transposase
MSEITLYETVLGLESPWTVVDVVLDAGKEVVEVHVESSQRVWPCPVCGEPCPVHDTQHRRWRHLDTCQYQTVLVASVPRAKCRRHGVKQVPVPWADRGSRFTAQFEARVLRWLQEASISAVGGLFGLSWSVIDGIMQRAIQRGLKRRGVGDGISLPEHLGVDETSFQRRHEYVTVICDQGSGDVVHVADGRSASAVEEYLAIFSEAERAGVKTVAMDMWQAYISAVERQIPDAEKKICFDKFHMAQHLGGAVDKVRRQEHRKLLGGGQDALKGSRFLWLANPENLSDERLAKLEWIFRIAVKTARAWAIKEAGMEAWSYRTRRAARTALLKWYGWAIRSRLQPVKKVARMVKAHLEGLVNAIVHGVTNARAEGINARIQWIKYTARGFRNRERFRNAIYFHLAGLDMTPETLKPITFHTR